MTEFQSNFLIAALFMLVAGQYKYNFPINIVWVIVAIIWMINGIVSLFY